MISVLVNKTGRVSPAPAQCCQISRAHAHWRRFNFAPTQRSRRAAALLACRARSAVYVFFLVLPCYNPPLHRSCPLNYNFIANETILLCVHSTMSSMRGWACGDFAGFPGSPGVSFFAGRDTGSFKFENDRWRGRATRPNARFIQPV